MPINKTSSIDEDEVQKIVETMKKKYREEGQEFEETTETLKELRGIISENSYSKIDISSPEDIENFDSPYTQFFGKTYLSLKGIIDPLQKMFKNFSITKELSYNLYSANMRYSAKQYLAISTAVGFLVGLFGTVLVLIISAAMNMLQIAVLAPLIGGLFFLFGTMFALWQPKKKAITRGEECSVELPFALRHMATELKAGVGLYKTIQAVAIADYGTLSEEFARTITEIEEGADTSAALKHLALRTYSRPLRTAIMHTIRAMKIGGNLSEIMSDIAEDVSEDLKNRVFAFSQKMNFFAVVFIFAGIVLPVGITILGAIRNAPALSGGGQLFSSIPLTPEIMMAFYLIVMPIVFIGMIYIIQGMQPKM
jgi:pilus assembly protein TadC